jgi:hypothetical protein
MPGEGQKEETPLEIFESRLFPESGSLILLDFLGFGSEKSSTLEVM